MVGSVAAPDRNLAAMVFTIKRADSVRRLDHIPYSYVVLP
jgi:hypothetical protein